MARLVTLATLTSLAFAGTPALGQTPAGRAPEARPMAAPVATPASRGTDVQPAAAPTIAPAPGARAPAPADVAAPPSAPRAAEPPSEPPPSAWDREQRARGEPPDDGRSLAGQIWRTLLSLLLVVGLIYGIGRAALWRLGRSRGAGAGGAGMKVVERMALDTKHSLFVVEVAGEHRFLLGTGGTEGVKLLATLALHATPGGTFAGAMAAASSSGPAEGTQREGGS